VAQVIVSPRAKRDVEEAISRLSLSHRYLESDRPLAAGAWNLPALRSGAGRKVGAGSIRAGALVVDAPAL